MVRIPSATGRVEPALPGESPATTDACTDEPPAPPIAPNSTASEIVAEPKPSETNEPDLVGVATNRVATDGAASGDDTADGDANQPTAPAGPSEASPIPTPDDRQPFRVVVTFKPARDRRWTACIGVGRVATPGTPTPVDPVFETLACDDIADALDAVAGVFATAEAKWVEHPRNARAALAAPAKRDRTATDTPNSDQNQQPRERQRPGRQTKPAAAPTAPKPPASPSPRMGEKLALF